MTLFEQALTELRLLESHWISLLSWLSEKTGVSQDDLVGAWSADDYYKASTRLAADTKKAAGAKWTILDFIDFGSYVHLASRHGDQLAPLGLPPKDWVAQFNRQMAREGLVSFRNHLQHANRFALLPKAEQERGIALLKGQSALLTKWWPDCPVSLKPPPAESPLRAALRALGPDPDDALPLIEQIGLNPIANAPNLIKSSGVQTQLSKQLESDLDALYRVGEIELGGARASVYLACVSEWPERSAKREPIRRRVAKALREAPAEEQRIVIFVDAAGKSPEAEFVLPRVRAGKGVGTVRAVVSMADPTRHHVQLLESLDVSGVANIPALARKWIEAFSVETVTTRFYTEFRELRDRLIDDLLANNAANPALTRDRKKDPEFDLELHAFGTRQLSRILFLWFLQQKRWLGNSAGDGNLNFLTDLFRDHGGKGDAFFADVLTPIFFNGLGRRSSDPKHRAAEEFGGALPYLGGGIFTLGANEFEAQLYALNDEGEPTRRVALSDDLFDPRKDESDGPIGKGKSRKRSVLGLLRGYRFTTQESTPDDQSIDPDPELLGKVFENLYQADERHATGAYYTPREIVQFMCRRTLDGYLGEQTGATQGTLDWLREEAVDWSASDRQLSAAESDALILALERVRVLDPAVGSGAFLLTMMHEIVTLRRGIEQSESDKDVDTAGIDVADWKRRVATDSLYGVDINPMAVEICHLRLWLSIIVDLEVSNYRQIPALPNLDFRIVAGDSLIDRMGEDRFFESLPLTETKQLDLLVHNQVKDAQKQLDGLKDKFSLAEGAPDKDQKRLRDLRKKIREKHVEIAHVQLASALDKAKADLNLLQGPKAKPATKKKIAGVTAHATNLRALQSGLRADGAYQKPFLWPVNFHDVFEAGGFDIVLANPPYVRQEQLNAIDQQAYAHAFTGVHAGTADLLVYFYARAVQVLREGGQLGFITSNKYMRAAYGAKIREFLPANLQLRQIIDFGDLPLFDAAAYPAVLIGAKTAEPDGDGALQVADLVYPVRRQLAVDGLPVNPDNVRLALQDLSGLLAEAAVNDYPQSLLRRDGWILEEPALVRLFDRLMSQGTPLGAFVERRMYRGVLTGLNEAFVIDEAKRVELIAAHPGSAELIKPWLRGRDIRRWAPEWAGLYVIFTRHGTDIEHYPAIKKHLSRWRANLTPKKPGDPRDKPGRKPGDYKWFEIQDNLAYHAEFAKPKIVWPRNVPPWECRFGRDDAGSYINDKAYMMPGLGDDVCRYLNSPLVLWLVSKLTTKLQGGWLELKADTVVARLPIPATLPEQNTTGGIELHQSVSAAFGISAEEAGQVWDWCQQQQVYRGAMMQTDDDDDT